MNNSTIQDIQDTGELKQELYKKNAEMERLQGKIYEKEQEIKWIPRTENQQADELSKEPLIKAGVIKAESEKEKCPKCNGYLTKRSGKFGKFYGCSNYPKCRFTKKL